MAPFRPILLLAAIAGAFFVSCAEPPEKPIPELNPSSINTEPSELRPAPAPQKSDQQKLVTRMPLGDLYSLVQKNAALVYDVRPTLYYKMGHIPNAISWPRKDFERNLAKHEPQIRNANTNNTPVVIYCTDMACPDAQAVATELAKRGHSVSILQGGYAAWKIAAD